MSANQNQNIPKKGDFIVNPNTQRVCKVGSRTWLGLVKLGLVSGHYRDPRELDTVPDEYNDDDQYVEQKIQSINKTLPRGKQAVRGRGKYKGKIVARNTQPSAEEISRYTAQIASRAVNNNIEELSECDDLEGMLEKMIMEEMMATRPKTAPPIVRKKVGRPKAEIDDNKYQVEEPPEDEEEEEDYEFDDDDFE
tara:strand:- start:500 stop:1081 length:582 start_codon:yes stop_codon:yes gene_type:complete